jgi:hypothetical protein
VVGFFGEHYKDLVVILKDFENLTPHLLRSTNNESNIMIVYIGDLRQLKGGGAGACVGTNIE